MTHRQKSRTGRRNTASSGATITPRGQLVDESISEIKDEMLTEMDKIKDFILDEMTSIVESKMDQLEKRVTTKLDTVEHRLSSINEKIERRGNSNEINNILLQSQRDTERTINQMCEAIRSFQLMLVMSGKMKADDTNFQTNETSRNSKNS